MARPFYVAGPCVIEPETLFAAAEVVASVRGEFGVDVYFKASFDKANRTHVDAHRGPGLEEGLRLLQQVRERFDLKLLTDVHEPDQCAPAAEVADVLQVPAFLCRQTSLIQAAAATGKTVNIKRGQFLDPRRMHFAVAKTTGNAWVTERGTAFGHGDLVFDPRSLVWLRAAGVPVLYDCTHSVQAPGGTTAHTGGHRDLALPLARAAAAVGVDGFYCEVHPNPPSAKSDAATQLAPATFRALVRQTLEISALR